ncbi:MAG: hypothetical protein ACJZ39_01180 [Candidatus Thalassarchaeaceae archaeon]
MRQIGSILLIAFFLSSTIPGCLSDSEGGISLVVNYENTNGTVVESYIDGEHVSTLNVSLDFDFSNTVSELKLVEFGVDPGDGRDPVSVDSDAGSSITVEFTEHGIYEIVAYAKDEQNRQESTTVVIRIDLNIEWSEYSTHEPSDLLIDPIPKNSGLHPSAIFIHSTVENPELIENIGGGREVEITWRLFDQAEEACLIREGVVDEGNSINWEAFHYNTYEIHELRISYDEGQDNINIEQSVSLEYQHIESAPNP